MDSVQRDVKLSLSRLEYAVNNYHAVTPRRFRPYAYFLWLLGAYLATWSGVVGLLLGLAGLGVFALSCRRSAQAENAWEEVQQCLEDVKALQGRGDDYRHSVSTLLKTVPSSSRKFLPCA